MTGTLLAKNGAIIAACADGCSLPVWAWVVLGACLAALGGVVVWAVWR